ncbi:MAG: FlgO family outer membrane protein [Desulfobulbaceae bacterium]|nr:FlgO family outer membrane protein [Desulfobulbaceae bacterium]
MKQCAQLLVLVLCLIFVSGNVLADFQKNKIAVLPFNLQGENFETEDMGKIVAEWLITAFVKEGRFEVIERKLLGQVLEEQQMIEAGLVTQETASEIGKLLGVKVIISGSVMKLRDVMEVNARIIDVASASIVTAESVSSRNVNNLQALVIEMADKIIRNFPLEGYIANRNQTRVVIDLGEDAGVKPGMKFMAYKEGEVVRHPKTDEILYVKQLKTGIIKVTSVQRKISEGVIVEETDSDAIEYGDYVKSLNELSPPSYVREGKDQAAQQDKKTAVQAAPIEPPKTRIAPVSQKKVVSTPPRSSLSAELRSYLDMLRGNDARQSRWAAKKLYRTYPYEAEVLQEVNKVLLQGYNSKLEDKNHIDAMAWLCKLLANSKENKYMATVQEVIDRTDSPKIKKHAEKAIKSFPGYTGS